MSETTLHDFLLARIAKDEAVARSVQTDDTARQVAMLPEPTYSFVVHNGPERVLAGCEAKRRIVEEHYYMPRHDSRDFGFEDGNCVTCRKQGPCVTLRLLALPYADHPNSRAEWKP